MAKTKNEIIEGSDLMLFVSGASGYRSVAFATNHTLNISTSVSDTSNKDVGAGLWSSTAVRQLSYTISTENLYSIGAYDKLFDAMIAKTPLKVCFAPKNASEATAEGNAPASGWTPDAASAATHYEGEAVITSLNVTAQNGDNATFTAELAGVGALTKVTSAAQHSPEVPNTGATETTGNTETADPSGETTNP